MNELGLLARIAAVSSVSGGSILNAFLIDRLVAMGRSLGDGFSDWQREVADAGAEIADAATDRPREIDQRVDQRSRVRRARGVELRHAVEHPP